MTELRFIEAHAFLLLSASTAVGAIGRILWPEYYFVPDLALVALLALVVFGSVKYLILGPVETVGRARKK